MADVLLTRRAVIVAESESAFGQDANPAAANAILTTQPEISFESEMYERDVTRQTLSPLPPRVTNIDVNISFSCEIKGNGSATKYYDASGPTQKYPEVHPLLLACGMKTEDLSSDTSRVYVLDTDSGTGTGATPSGYQSCTIYVYWSGHQYKITGCVGTFSVSMEQGGIGLYNFEMKGQFNRTDANWNMNVDVLSNPVYNQLLPPLCAGSVLTIEPNGFSSEAELAANTLEFALNNEVSSLRTFENDNATSERFYISARKPTGSFNPLVERFANTGTTAIDWFEIYKNATDCQLSMVLGTETYNKVTFDFGYGANNNTITELGFEDDNGARRYNVGFQMNGSFGTGDDEFKITYNN